MNRRAATHLEAKQNIVERLRSGDRRAVARLITWAEAGDPRFARALSMFYSSIGSAWRVGVTGPPGAGKSTLVNELAIAHRAAQKTVGILAVDPSSPFTGGALLGDRIRMEDRTSDPGVFIRSMASRDSHGGLARAAIDACDVMDAYGFDEVIVETVGVGQAEYDVVSAADTVLVVLCPGAGDGIQAMKSGLLEVADVLVVNKSDMPGADRLIVDLEEAVELRSRKPAGEWTVPVVACSAGRGQGIDAVLAAVEAHRAHLADGRLEARRGEMREGQVRRLVHEGLESELWHGHGYAERSAEALESGAAPYDVAGEILAEIVGRLPGRGTTRTGAAT
ncbi:MAG: methylmalonyl Co-A mutase-associated GTPase MeaB [Planctomycetes bacterium]|nr:methylmalonyl Co-A mutase-associated GTPase MeaB [Planctomycetota bacterium]MCB9903249.1 methylmalonyl Co-A mutase-associated GTPase MeaB [Planctomycetota bacterium]